MISPVFLALALGLLALAPLLWPLLRPSPLTGPTAAPARGLALLLAVAVPGLALWVYLSLGQPQLLRPGWSGEALSLASLTERTQREPDNPEAWRALAHEQEAQGQLEPMQHSLRELIRLQPQAPEPLLDLAVTLAMSRGQGLSGESEQLIAQALRLAPDHVQALALAGSARYDQGDPAGAIVHWQRLLSLIDANTELARNIEAGIERARREASAPGGQGSVP